MSNTVIVNGVNITEKVHELEELKKKIDQLNDDLLIFFNNIGGFQFKAKVNTFQEFDNAFTNIKNSMSNHYHSKNKNYREKNHEYKF